MKSLWIVAVLVCVVLTSGVWAQSMVTVSPRAAGMGGAGIGVADDAAAWYQNPAGLGALKLTPKAGSDYANDAIFGYANNNDESAWGITWSGWKPKDDMGFGAGYGWLHDTGCAFGAGFGASFKSCPLSLGLNVMGVNPDGPGGDKTLLDLGAMYRISQGKGKAPVRVGLTVNDITEQEANAAVWSAGVAWPATPDLLLALDVMDMGAAWNNQALVSGGAEYALGKAKDWRARAGFMGIEDSAGNDSTRLTLGAGYASKQWRVDAAYVDTNPDATWTVGLGVHF